MLRAILTLLPQLCSCTHTKASLLTTNRHCLLLKTSHGRVPAQIPGRAGASLSAFASCRQAALDMYLYTCFGELAQPLPALRPVDNRFWLVLSDMGQHQPALPFVDNRPRMRTASAFFKNITQVLHAYLSKRAYAPTGVTSSTRKIKAEVCGLEPRLCNRRVAVARANRTHARTRNQD